MTDATIGVGVTGYYKCRECGYRISPTLYLEAAYDYTCPICGGQTISQFMHIPGVSAA